MLHFLSPPPELEKNTAPAPRHRSVQALPRHAIPWPFRVAMEDASVDLADICIDPLDEPASDCAFVS